MEAIFSRSHDRYPHSDTEAQQIRVIGLIDDSDDDEFLLRRVLQKAAIPSTLLRFPGGAAAVDYFRRKGPYADRQLYPDCDLVFLDIRMPDVSGFDVLKALRLVDSALMPLVVVMSGAEDMDAVNQSLELGAISYSPKPPTEAFLAQLRTELGLVWSQPRR